VLTVTVVPWLLVLDNIDDLDIARQCWPAATSGNVLVTSRNPVVEVDPAAGGHEVELFDDKDSAALILKLIGRSTYSEEEQAAVASLSSKLSGLPLALTLMAYQIKLRKVTIERFNTFYDNYSQRLHSEIRGTSSHYKHSLSTCWLTAFRYLSDTAEAILGMCALVAPDQIPEDLFKADSNNCPTVIDFCQDEWR
jgi:NB-ARC domain